MSNLMTPEIPTHLSAQFHDHTTPLPLARSPAGAHQLFGRIRFPRCPCIQNLVTQGITEAIGSLSQANISFLHLIKKSFLMIDRKDKISKMTYPPGFFRSLYNTDMLFFFGVPGIATVGVGAVSGKSTSSSSSAKRSREPSRNGTGQPPTAKSFDVQIFQIFTLHTPWN